MTHDHRSIPKVVRLTGDRGTFKVYVRDSDVVDVERRAKLWFTRLTGKDLRRSNPYKYIYPDKVTDAQERKVLEHLLKDYYFWKFNNRTRLWYSLGNSDLKETKKQLKSKKWAETFWKIKSKSELFEREAYLECLEKVKLNWLMKSVNNTDKYYDVKSCADVEHYDSTDELTEICVKGVHVEEMTKKVFEKYSETKNVVTNELFENIIKSLDNDDISFVDITFDLETNEIQMKVFHNNYPDKKELRKKFSEEERSNKKPLKGILKDPRRASAFSEYDGYNEVTDLIDHLEENGEILELLGFDDAGLRKLLGNPKRVEELFGVIDEYVTEKYDAETIKGFMEETIKLYEKARPIWEG